MHSRTHELPDLQLTDPVWTIEHIAAALRIGTRAARDVITRPGFPMPARLGAARTARAYWLRDDVLAWLQGLASPTAVGQSTGVNPRRIEPPRPRPMARAAKQRPAASPDDALALIQALPTVRGRVPA